MIYLHVFTVPFALIGLVVFFWVFMPSKAPADKSNRVARLTALWITLTRYEEVFPHMSKFFKQDMFDNIRDVGK